MIKKDFLKKFKFYIGQKGLRYNVCLLRNVSN